MKHKLSVIYILIAATLWGCIGIFYQQLSDIGFSRLQVVFLRVMTAAVLMAGYLLVRDPSWFRIRLRDCWMFVGTGIVSLAFFNFCYFSAMTEISYSAAATLLYTAPIFVVLLSSLLFSDRLTWRVGVCVLLTFLGCVLVTGVTNGVHVTTIGIMFGIGSGIGYALYSIFSVYALRRYRTETITFYTFVFAAIGVLPFCQMRELAWIFCAAPVAAAVNTGGIGFFACLLPYLLYTKGLCGVKPGQASVMATLEPVVASIVGMLLLGDSTSVLQIVGVILIVLSIVFLNIPKRTH